MRHAHATVLDATTTPQWHVVVAVKPKPLRERMSGIAHVVC